MAGRPRLYFNLNMSDVESGDDEEYGEINSIQNQDRKRKRYHRHTPAQIQRLEAFFKHYPHPSRTQRIELSEALEMEPMQVKFWFQNKRTQMKSMHERLGNLQLREENDRLRQENLKLKEAMNNACCPTCGATLVFGDHLTGDEEDHKLRVENNRLRQEIDRISAIAAECVGKAVANYVDVDAASTSKGNK